MNFVDFQLRAWVASDDQLEVLVHSSPVGAMRQPLKVPFNSAEYQSICEMIRKAWLSQPGLLPEIVKAGKQLSRFLLPTEVYAYLIRSLTKVGDDGLRLRLCLDEALVDGPWEFLHRPDALDDEMMDGFLVLNPQLSLVREAPVETLKLKPSDKQERMVIVGAYKFDGEDLWQVEQERQQLISALDSVKAFLKIDDKFVTAADDNIEEALNTPVTVFHYSGHVQIEGSRGFLVCSVTSNDFENSVCDSNHFDPLYSDRKLDVLMRRSGARIGVFSACNSGQWPFVEPLLKAGLPALIGVQGSTMCDAAIVFCQKLYESLAIGLSLDEAVIYARLRLQQDKVVYGADSCEWGSYMVYMPTTEAVLLPKAKQATQVQAQQEEVRRDVSNMISNRSLRLALMKAFDESDLKTLCADIKEDLKRDEVEMEIDLEIVGGTNKEAKIVNLIEYLERRDSLVYLINAARRSRDNFGI